MNEVEEDMHADVLRLNERGFEPAAYNIDTRTTETGMVAQVSIYYRKVKETDE